VTRAVYVQLLPWPGRSLDRVESGSNY
jgi:hypothetical protein